MVKKINLFALTGLGNKALEYLIENGHDVMALYTRNEPSFYPYFDTEHVYDLAKRHGIKIYFIDSNNQWHVDDEADLNLICTFHRLLKEHHRRKAKVSINIHPAPIPKYTGRNPFLSIVRDGTDKLGINTHIISDEQDSGEIIVKTDYIYKPKDEADLRMFLTSKIKENMELIFQRIIT